MSVIYNDNLYEKCSIVTTTCTINEGVEYIVGGDFTKNNIDLIILPNTVFNINQMPKFGGIKIKVSKDNVNVNVLTTQLSNHGYEYNEENQ